MIQISKATSSNYLSIVDRPKNGLFGLDANNETQHNILLLNVVCMKTEF